MLLGVVGTLNGVCDSLCLSHNGLWAEQIITAGSLLGCRGVNVAWLKVEYECWSLKVCWVLVTNTPSMTANILMIFYLHSFCPFKSVLTTSVSCTFILRPSIPSRLPVSHGLVIIFLCSLNSLLPGFHTVWTEVKRGNRYCNYFRNHKRRRPLKSPINTVEE